jgi:predicted lactoylglutathione lyase
MSTPQMIFVNLPVRDLARSRRFFEALGFGFNPQFTDETAACMVISETIFAMLLTHEKFATFTPKKGVICDAKQSTEVLIALSRENRAAVDDIVKKAVAAGGNTFSDPQDHGFMYAHAFQDLDGHVWEVMWMDPAAVQ